MNTFAESAQLALEDEELENMIPIYAAAAITDNHENGIDDWKFDRVATEFPLADECDTWIKGKLDVIGQH